MTPRDETSATAVLEFAHLGVPHIAYVKRVVIKGDVHYAIHAADGTEMGAARDRDAAVATLRQNGFEALSVH
jgi:hypothetical protein